MVHRYIIWRNNHADDDRLNRSYVIQEMRMLAVTWANATRGKSVFWLQATVRRGHPAVR